MRHKQRIEDLLIEFDEMDMQPLNTVGNSIDKANAWKQELTYSITHLEAEIAAEIFAKIDERISRYRKDQWYTLADMQRDIQMLKTKYTEGEK